MTEHYTVDGINFPTDYTPVPAMLGETPVTVKSATETIALIILPDDTETTVTVERLHR